MKPVVQIDAFSCGIACVASILSVDYNLALNLFTDGKIKAQKNGFYCKEIVTALKSIGINYQYKYVNKKIRNKIYLENVIVFIKRSKRYPAGHYLCRIDKTWFDSWINFPEKNKKSGIRKRLPGKPIYVIYPI